MADAQHSLLSATGAVYWLRMTYGCNGRSARDAWPGDPNPPEGFEKWRDPRPAEPAYPSCGYEMAFLLEYGCEGPKGPVTGFTPDGKQWVPVPFGAGPCPNCGKGELLHVRWREDAEVHEVGPLEVPHFRYPTEAEFRKYGDQACGVPVYAQGAASRG